MKTYRPIELIFVAMILAICTARSEGLWVPRMEEILLNSVDRKFIGTNEVSDDYLDEHPEKRSLIDGWEEGTHVRHKPGLVVNYKYSWKTLQNTNSVTLCQMVQSNIFHNGMVILKGAIEPVYILGWGTNFLMYECEFKRMEYKPQSSGLTNSILVVGRGKTEFSFLVSPAYPWYKLHPLSGDFPEFLQELEKEDTERRRIKQTEPPSLGPQVPQSGP